MESNLDNVIQQTEEIEALTSIFGDQLKIDDQTGICSIDVAKSVKLYITLVPDYPSKSLPKYELLAPELSAKQKQMINHEFQNIFMNGDKGPLIYQMILAVDEIAKQTTDDSEQKLKTEQNLSESNEDINVQTVTLKADNLKLKDPPVLNIVHGPVILDRKSCFQGHVCGVKSKEDVKIFMENLMENRKIAGATHNITAYRIQMQNNIILQDCDDDGENKAAGRLLDLLQTLKLVNVMVVVSRWYGGVHLGPDRFRHINNAARQALIAGDYLKL